MEEQLIALEAPPRTLDVQQFARARAAELLSLHTVLNKNKKRKSSSISSSHGELQDVNPAYCHANEDDVDLCHTFTSLPRHLRRRTSSYARRHRPLPWLYKKKKKATSSSSLLPTNKRKRQRKQRQSQLPMHCTALPFQVGRDKVAVISSQVGVDWIGLVGRDGITGCTSRSRHGSQQDIAAPSSPLQQSKIEAEQLNLPDLHQPKPVDCSIASSCQPSIDGVSLKDNDCTLSSHVSADVVDVTEIAAPGQVDTHELQQQPDGIAMMSIDGIGTTAPLQVGCNATQNEAAHGATSMDLVGVPVSFQIGSHGVHEYAVAFPFRDDKDTKITMGEDNSASPASGHAAQHEAVQEEEDRGVLVQVHNHQVQLEAFAVTQGFRERIASLGVDYTIAPAQVDCNTAQQDGFELTSQVETKAPHIDGISPTQRCNLQFEPRPSDTKTRKKVCRALRRLIEFKPGGSLISSDGTRRLGTHIWHAKRFTIEKKWGFRIPLGRPGRGHGSRAVLRWAREKALLHDASFINAIQLHGKVEEIMKVLTLMLELPQSIDCCLEDGPTVHSWRGFTTALLHHVGQAPHKVISSVVLMWKPVTGELSTHNGATVKNEDFKDQDLWLWVHAAAFEEALKALKDICCQLNEEAKEERVHCFSRKGDLGRLDLIGQNSFAVLEKILFPIYRDLQGKCITLHELAAVINPTQIKGNSVVHMEVSDPRLKQSERCLALDPVLSPYVSVFEDKNSLSQELLEKDGKSVKKGTVPAQAAFNLSLNLEGVLDHYCSNESIDALWACETKPSQQKFRSPVKEKFLSKMRHTDRLESFGFIQESIKINRMLERRKNLSGRFRCPVILLNHEHEKASGCGWSVILPLSWISAFWVPLVFAGGHVIGIRERHWLYTDAGTPSFPEDFPDSKAYTELMAAKSLQDTKGVPKRYTKKLLPGSSQTCESIPGKACYVPSGQCPIKPSVMPSAIDSWDFGSSYLIARTSEQLMSYLGVTNQTGLLLFPAPKQIKEKFKGLGRRLHEGTVAWHARSQTQERQSMNIDQAACILRVSIRPFHKGVVEVGATVYAPTSEEYTRWSCMEKPPTISPSGTRLHDNSESTIGYVTSMAPRGSKIAAAIAFCDAVALGLARGRQWVETTWHKNNEIFLMFCNQGSSTFRPAFASIYLEKGPDI